MNLLKSKRMSPVVTILSLAMLSAFGMADLHAGGKGGGGGKGSDGKSGVSAKANNGAKANNNDKGAGKVQVKGNDGGKAQNSPQFKANAKAAEKVNVGKRGGDGPLPKGVKVNGNSKLKANDAVNAKTGVRVNANQVFNGAKLDTAARQQFRANLLKDYSGQNNLRVGNRNIRLTSKNYLPIQFRHRWYRGFASNNSNWGLNRTLRHVTGYRGFAGNGPNARFRFRLGNNNRWARVGGRVNPFGWGYGRWGLGNIAYRSGYLRYQNPYFVSGGQSPYNYSQPLNLAYDVPQDTDMIEGAIASFQQQDYESALSQVSAAITENPNDPALHEFRSLVLFAMGRYQESAASIYPVLALGPGWNWETMSSMYADPAIYNTQYRALEDFVANNPTDSSGHFLLGYHYMTGGYPEQAQNQFAAAAKTDGQQSLAADLATMLNPSNESLAQTDEDDSDNVDQSADDKSPVPAEENINKKELAGEWTATRDDGDQFHLTLTPDSKFVWKFKSDEGKTDQKIEGTYSADENVLTLESPEQGTLVAEVDDQNANGFNFKLLGTDDADPGLKFRPVTQ